MIFLNERTRHRVSVPQMLPHLQPCYQPAALTVADSSLDLLKTKRVLHWGKNTDNEHYGVLNLWLEAGNNVFIQSFSISADYSPVDNKEWSKNAAV